MLGLDPNKNIPFTRYIDMLPGTAMFPNPSMAAGSESIEWFTD